jgi:hypothetical protein
MGRMASGNDAGGRGHHEEGQRDCGQDGWISRLDLVKERRQQPGGEPRGSKAGSPLPPQ